jgi:uncharacterized protein YjgD (DUF1641 family)
MANPVAFRTFTPADERRDLMRELEAAPREHADAILEAYALLERLHSAKILATANGLLSAGDTLVDRLTNVVSSQQAVTLLQVGLILGDIATSLDAARLQKVVEETKAATPSWFSLTRRIFSADTRRMLGLTLGLLEIAGGSLRTSGGKK